MVTTRHTGMTVRNLLSATKLKAKKPGMHADGGNLYLQVKAQSSGNMSRSWVFRYMAADARRRELGLGPLVDVSLANARTRAGQYRAMLRDGIDPLQERSRRRQEMALAASRAIAFKDCCADYIEAHAPSWRNSKHRSQWENTLSTYAYPIMGSLLVSDIGTEHVEAVLRPIWNTKRETARRLRARIERVLSWATVRKYRQGDNPARWDGNL
ncbi:MAG: Arm DNA-binding domain-containing protein, partial [Gammaproteobacteria bacterium]|nr:Arm DNA-binding domain-containing protein [Gammaproteobacteria bacterium]